MEIDTLGSKAYDAPNSAIDIVLHKHFGENQFLHAICLWEQLSELFNQRPVLFVDRNLVVTGDPDQAVVGYDHILRTTYSSQLADLYQLSCGAQLFECKRKTY